MQAWWENLAPRERLLVAGGGTILLLLLIYQLILSPIHNGLANLRMTVQSDQQLLVWMQASSQKILALQGSGTRTQVAGAEALLATTQQSVRSSAIGSQLTSIQQSQNNTVDVKFNKVAFDALTQWLISLRQQFGIQVKQLQISRVSNDGMVQASITLQAGNA